MAASALDIFKAFLSHLNASSVYKNWATSHATDAARWKTYSTAIANGQTANPPTLASAFGVALVQVGMLAQTQIAAGAVYGQAVYGTSTY